MTSRSESELQLDALMTEVQRLRDVEEITRLQATYWRLSDGDIQHGPTHLAEPIGELFTEDGSWQVLETAYEGITLPGVQARGRDELVARCLKQQEGIPFAMHFGIAPIVIVDGDDASGLWRVLGVSTLADGRAFWAGADYSVEYRRTAQGWRIASVTVTRGFRTPYTDGWAKQRYA